MELLLEYGVSLVLAFGVFYLAYIFFYEAEEAASKFKDEQTRVGDAGLAELYVQLPPELFFFIRVVLAGAFAYIGFAVAGTMIAAVMGLFGFAIPGLVLGNLRRKRVRKFEQQLVEGLELLGNSLKSGLTLQQATELLVKEFPAPISQEFSLVLAEVRLGVDFTEGLENMANRLDSNITHILASGVAITKRCGGDLNIIFQNIASTIREQAKVEGKLEAVTAQGRFQGMILSVMPFALMFILWFIDPQHVETLFQYTIGNWAIILVIVMVGMAQAWISRLLSVDV